MTANERTSESNWQTGCRSNGEVAIVHEWIAARAGSEQVFEVMARVLPTADLYALSADPSVHMDYGGRTLRTTFLDHPWLRDHRSVTLPLMPLAWKALGKGTYRLVLTSHHALASSNRLGRLGNGSHRLLYVYTPARYIWDPQLDGRGVSPLLAPARALLRRYDRKQAQTFTSIAAISNEVASRIKEHWGLNSRVIYPPVDTEYFTSDNALSADGEQPTFASAPLPDQFLLSLGRWIPYKNPGFVISLAEALGTPAIIAGKGPLASSLRRCAGAARVPIQVIENPTRATVRHLLHRASALIFPAREDFGIVPVESLASGTPVVALAKGGATETVIDGLNGALVPNLRIPAFVQAVRRIGSINAEACRESAQRFGRQRFVEEIEAWISECSDD